MDSSIEVRIRSSTAKGNYKVATDGVLIDMLAQILIQEEIIASVGELKGLIDDLDAQNTKLLDQLKIKSGFPPKVLNIAISSSQYQDLSVPLSSLKIRSNENLIIEVDAALASRSQSGAGGQASAEGGNCITKNGFTQLKVPSDGSCLFNSITLAFDNTTETSEVTRSTVAAYILSDPAKYNKQFLGGTQEPAAYAEWICRPSKEWGGIPELKILGDHYKSQISVLDVGNDEIIPFKGCDPAKANFDTFIFVVFDGSHYNLGAQKIGEGEYKKIFKVEEFEAVAPDIKELGKMLKESGQFIDPNLFALKCCDCGKPMEGQIDAVEHAKATSHQNFSQIEGNELQE